jgi:nitroreductase
MDPIAFLDSRRSPALRGMSGPGPDDAALDRILRAAIRVPDHGMLAPWRIVILRGPAKERYADALADLYRRLFPEATDEQVMNERRKPLMAPLTLAVISKPRIGHKIPEFEQLLSGAAVCQTLLFAVQAVGFAAVWLTGWPAYRPEIVELLGFDPATDRVVGFVHIGTAALPAEDRPRPALSDIVSEWTAPATALV